MDGVLEEAAVLGACKLTSSLLFLPTLVESRSPVGFCSCCMLIFTDFLVTAFLIIRYIFGFWLTTHMSFGDVIALRFVLFLSHTYGVVLLLTVPLIAVETLTRLLWPPEHTESQTSDNEGQLFYVGEETVEKEDTERERSFSRTVSYLCCLSVWVMVALDVNCRWKMDEEWAVVCLHMSKSLVKCLPNLLSPMPSSVNPCWGMALLSLLMLLITTSTSLDRWRGAPTWTKKEVNRGGSVGGTCWKDFVLVKFEPQAEQCVDPEKTESSCPVHRAYSWNSVQMPTSHHGDVVLIPPGFISAGKGGQEQERTKRGILLTFIIGDHVDPEHRSHIWWGQWGFSRLGVKVMIGFVSVFSVFVLPLNLTVNILLIRTIETLLELCIKSLVPSTTNKNNTTISQNETLL